MVVSGNGAAWWLVYSHSEESVCASATAAPRGDGCEYAETKG